MSTFDRHLLREWLQILVLVLAVTCGLLLMQVCHDDLRDLREAGARGWELWRYLFIAIPSFFAFVLPFGVLFSVLFVLTKFHRANEITAMRAAGVGFLRLMAPLWVGGALCCAAVWWLNSSVVPWSTEASRALKESLQFRQQSRTLPPDRVGAVYDVGFENLRQRRVWFMNRYSRSTRHGYGVEISELDPQRRESARLLAAEAWRSPAGGWVFVRGRLLQFNVDTGEQLASVPFAERREPDFKEDPSFMLLLSQRPIDLSVFELRRVMDYYTYEDNPKGLRYAQRYFALMAETLRPLIAIALAIPFAIAGVRVNPAVGVSKSIGLFVLYYLFANVADFLSTKGVVAPDLAAWLPDMAMGAVAAWFFARLR
ncbi:MAG TPA: LptF/LptG family permease [Opitutaceae bacterium]|nr:LptF/LptG family permease [Opitutaceae bacterium]